MSRERILEVVLTMLGAVLLLIAVGDTAAQCGLGLMYAKGQGVPRDCAQAALWLRKAAEQGDAEAQDSLGVLYGNGEGVPQDYAALWFRKAAEQGNANAQDNLGYWYEEGEHRGVAQDNPSGVLASQDQGMEGIHQLC